MQFFTRDWLDNKELRRCSPVSRAVLADLMCLAHEGKPYGFLSDNVGALTVKYMASRCMVTTGQFLKSVAELVNHHRLIKPEDGPMYIERMVNDERVRLSRAAGGVKGGNPSLVTSKVNLTSNLIPPPQGSPHSRARMRADSDSESGFVSFPEVKKEIFNASNRFNEFWQRYPLKTGENVCAGVWLSVVSVEAENDVFACLERYLASEQVSRSVIMRPNNWLHDAARDNWKCEWPPAKKNGSSPLPPGGKTHTELLTEAYYQKHPERKVC